MRYALLALILIVVMGCSETRRVAPSTNVGLTIGDTSRRLESALDKSQAAVPSINQAAKDIDATARGIENNPDATPEIQESASNIRNRTQDIQNETWKLQENLDQAQDENSYIQNLSKEVTRIEKDLAAAQSAAAQQKAEALQKLYQFAGIFFGIGFLMSTGGIILMIFVNRKVGATIFLVGLITTATAAAVTFYLKAVAVAGVAIIAAGLVVAGIILFRELQKSTKEKERLAKANRENVQLVQSLKEELPTETKTEYFGDPKDPNLVPYAHSFQSESTIEIVNGILKELKKESSAS